MEILNDDLLTVLRRLSFRPAEQILPGDFIKCPAGGWVQATQLPKIRRERNETVIPFAQSAVVFECERMVLTWPRALYGGESPAQARYVID